MRAQYLAGAALAITLTAQAHAASAACEPAPYDAARLAEVTLRAGESLDLLESIEEPVALIARVGQDLSNYGVKYSHMAFVIKRDGVWTVVHKLNECNTAKAGIYDQSLFEFYEDSDSTQRGAVWRLDARVAKDLVQALGPDRVLDYHEPHYNMVQYPFSTKYQNSNGWVLETLSSAIGAPQGEPKRDYAQAWLKAAGYQPQTVEVGFFKRLGARVTKESVSFDDHPNHRRWAGNIDTITVDSVISFLAKQGNVCVDKACNELAAPATGN